VLFVVASNLNTNKIVEIYESLGFPKNVAQMVASAHQFSLKYGIENGHECVLTIDAKSGEILDAVTSNERNSVKWKYLILNTKSVIGIHNHPRDLPFSAQDLFTFMQYQQIAALSVQCPNGIAYILHRNNEDSKSFALKPLEEFRDIIVTASDNKEKTPQQKGEIFVEKVAHIMKWTFVKEEVGYV
jgi:hypothetical protein